MGGDAYRKRALGAPPSWLCAGGGGCNRSPIQNGCQEAAEVRATETAGISGQRSFAQGRGVQEGQDPGTRSVCRTHGHGGGDTGGHLGAGGRGQGPPHQPQGTQLTSPICIVRVAVTYRVGQRVQAVAFVARLS